MAFWQTGRRRRGNDNIHLDKNLPDQEFQDIVDSLRLELDTGAPSKPMNAATSTSVRWPTLARLLLTETVIEEGSDP